MHVAFLNLLSDINSPDPDSFISSSDLPQALYAELAKGLPEQISVVQRATFTATIMLEEVAYYFVKDEFESSLLWWQEPVTIFEQLLDIQPDIIQISGLNLPLQFRWLRRIIGEKIKIIGENKGEPIWASRNLWLQQFGLRVADGFIFKNINDASSWTKASVILEKQPIADFSLSSENPEADAKLLIKFYQNL